jgi:hypothetical protein
MTDDLVSGDWSKQDLDGLLSKMFAEGMTSIIVGARGWGKTTIAMIFAYWCLQNGYHVLSNIICKKCIAIDDTQVYTKRGLRKQYKRIFSKEQYYPRNYHKVTSFADAFGVIGALLKEDPESKIVFIIDEGAIAIGSTESVFSRNVKSFFQFLTLARKFRTSTLVISVSLGLLSKRLREKEFGFLAAVVRKDIAALSTYAQLAMKPEKAGGQGIPKRDLFILEWPEYQRYPGDVDLFHVSPLDIPLAKPEAFAEVGDIVFDTNASADLGMGAYPGTQKQFDLRAMITYISDCTSEQIPERILEFLELGGKVTGVREEYGEEDIMDLEFAAPKKRSIEGGAMTRRLVRQEMGEMVSEGTYHSMTQAAKEIAERLQARNYDISWGAVYKHVEKIQGGEDEPTEQTQTL